jgi:GAF domain-containing protein
MKIRLSGLFRSAPAEAKSQVRTLLNLLLFGAAIAGAAYLVLGALRWAISGLPLSGTIYIIIALLACTLALILGRRGHLLPASWIATAVIFGLSTFWLSQSADRIPALIGLLLVVLVAESLLGLLPAAVFALLGLGAMVLLGVLESAGATLAATVALIALIAVKWLESRGADTRLGFERRQTQVWRAQSEELEQTLSERSSGLERRALQLETTAEVARMAAENAPPIELVERAVEIIQNRFGYYHAAIFLMDESGTWADLAAATGEAGEQLRGRHHRLAVGSASMIGWVTANRLPRVANDVSGDAFHFKNPLLPETMSEVAIPMMVGQQMVGALDVQSQQPDAFSEADVRALEVISDELAVSITNARLMTDMQSQLDDIQRQYQERAQESWSRLIQRGLPRQIRAGLMPETGRLDVSSGVAAQQASHLGQTIFSPTDRELAVPVEVRGDVIATISVRRPGMEGDWPPEDIALVEAIAGQAGLAMENARQRAEEHRRITELEVLNRISQAVSQLMRPESLLRIVHTQFDQVVGGTDLFVGLYDEPRQMMSFPYASEGGELIELPPAPLGEGLTSIVIRSRQALLLAENAPRQAAELGAKVVGKLARSWLGVPMMVGDEVLGIIAAQDPEQEHRFSDDDVALLTTIASQIATAFQNMRLLDQVQTNARRQRLIHEITSKVRRAPDIPSILQTTARELSRALNAAQASVWIGKDAPGGDGAPGDQATDAVGPEVDR